MWPFKRPAPQEAPARIHFTNTLTGNKEVFIPLKPGVVTMYSCGPTVYSRQHIGNLRATVFSDTIARVLEDAGYRVRRVINLTDVGHLVADADQGEDKMTVAAKREKRDPKTIADEYTRIFLDDIRDLNLNIDDILFPRATEYIKEQIALASTLEEKGFAYRTKEGLYFDTARFPEYGKLGNVAHAHLEAGKRVSADEKRHPADFALWRTAHKGDLQQWNSPWGYGNPGWHIECSAMSRVLLGTEIDIHTGGEDHIAVHHNNEIAQSEASTGRQFVRYWMHNAFLTMSGEKIAKSVGNIAYLSDITERGLHPLALRYFFLQAHYRTPLSFSFDAVTGAGGALSRLWRLVGEIEKESGGKGEPSDAQSRFVAAIRDDLNTPQALGILWESLKGEEFSPEEKWGLIERADRLLGLSLLDAPEEAVVHDVPEEVQKLLEERETARKAKDFKAADALRTDIKNRGYLVEDGPEGPVLTKAHR